MEKNNIPFYRYETPIGVGAECDHIRFYRYATPIGVGTEYDHIRFYRYATPIGVDVEKTTFLSTDMQPLSGLVRNTITSASTDM